MTVSYSQQPHYRIEGTLPNDSVIEVIQAGFEKIKITKGGREFTLTHEEAAVLAEVLQIETKKD